jgi:hypothetical protein
MSDDGPLRDEARRYWQRVRAQREAEERDRQAWIGEVKRRLRLVTIGDNPAGPGWHALPGGSAYRMTNDLPAPEWPILPEGTSPGDWQVVSEQAMASRDGVNFYVKPEGMTLAEFWASLP